MKTLALILLLEGAFAPPVDDFDARWEQVQLELGKLEVPDDQRKAAIDHLEKYFESTREEALQEGLTMLEEDDDGDTADDWQGHFQSMASTGSDHISGAVSKVKDVRLIKYLGQLAVSEAAFMNGIKGMPLASTRDQLAAWREEFKKSKENLLGRWRDLVNRDRSEDRRTDRFEGNSIKLYSELIDRIGRENTDLKKKIEMATEGTKSIAWYMGAVNSTMKWLDSLSTRLERVKSELDGLFRMQDPLVTMFVADREAVKDFLDDLNFDKASSAFKDCSSASQSAAGRFSSDGLKVDATLFAAEGIERLEARLEELEDEFESFTSKLRGIYFGNVEDKQVEELIELKDRQIYITKIESQGDKAVRLLKDLYDDMKDKWDADLDDLDADKKSQLERGISESLRELNKFIKVYESNTALVVKGVRTSIGLWVGKMRK